MIASLTARELPIEEWDKLRGIEPYASGGVPASDEHWKVFVVENETGQILGCTALHTEVHFDPWWLSPGAHPGVVRGLLREAIDLLQSKSIDHVFCTIEEGHHASQHAASHLGFTRAPGQLWLLDLDHLQEF
jgi:hypothetical protein